MSDLPMTHFDPYSLDAINAEYDKLCKQRDLIVTKAMGKRNELNEAAKVAEQYRVAAMKKAEELDAVYAAELGTKPGEGKSALIALKNRVGAIARIRQNLRDKQRPALEVK